MEKLINCPLCNNTDLKDFLNVKDFFLSKEDFIIQECKKCGFRFLNPRPESVNLQKYYNSEEYVSHSDTSKGLINKAYHIFRYYNLSKKYKIINSKKQNGKILDIGCGTAEFLKYCKNKNWEVAGIEPNDKAREISETKNHLHIIPENEITKLESNSFDIITLWHVLEHISDLNFQISEIKRLLKKEGYVFIAVPNHLCYDAFKYKEYWAAWDVPRHLYHFTQSSMKTLVQKYNFQIEEIFPMKLDAFYVSLLSEKYLNKKINYFSAFLTGLKSNHKAKTNNNFSSLIYVIKNSNV